VKISDGRFPTMSNELGTSRPRAVSATAPANGRRKLTDQLKEEIRALRSQGVSLRTIAKRVGIVHSGVYALLRRDSAPKSSRWSRRYSNCGYCGDQIAVGGSVTRSVCERCTDRLCPTIWRAGDPIEALPQNLHRYLQD
jgi:NADH pyrophosphatase NudC (nudix superfamily)